MGHEINDAISLELARRTADRLPNHPEWLELARRNLNRWSDLNADSAGLLQCYAEWREILLQPISEVCATLTAETDDGQRLRQNSPFAGALAPQEVWEVKRLLRRHEPTTA